MDEEAIVLSGGMSTRVGAKCGRWNPTTEQVKVLSDLFASGLRTPTTEQIQTISTHLSSFGKIESKNVFYWFQNHKARERHHKKRRRQHASGLVGSDHICHKAPEISKKEASRIPTCNKIVHEQEAIWERREREVETLQLFPLSSYSNWEGEKLRTIRNEWTEIQFLDAADPPLDLRLSFL